MVQTEIMEMVMVNGKEPRAKERLERYALLGMWRNWTWVERMLNT